MQTKPIIKTANTHQHASDFKGVAKMRGDQNSDMLLVGALLEPHFGTVWQCLLSLDTVQLSHPSPRRAPTDTPQKVQVASLVPVPTHQLPK